MLWWNVWPRQLRKQAFIEGFLTVSGGCHCHSGERGSRQACVAAPPVEQHRSDPKVQAKKQRLGLLWASETSEPTHSDTLLNPSQTIPPAGKQTFKYMRLWGPFSSKPTQFVSGKMRGMIVTCYANFNKVVGWVFSCRGEGVEEACIRCPVLSYSAINTIKSNPVYKR